MEGNDLSNVKVLEYYGVFNPPEGPGWKPVTCPFHDDSTASAGSNGSGFVCHACGVRGGPIQLLMQREGVDFDSAVQLAEEITGEVYGSLRRKVVAKRKRVDLSGEKRSYEGDGDIFSIGTRRGTIPRIRPRLLDG